MTRGEEPPRLCGSGTLSGIERARFERLVAEALDGIPDEIGGSLDNVDVVVDDWPTQAQLLGSGIGEGEYLLGLQPGAGAAPRGGVTARPHSATVAGSGARL